MNIRLLSAFAACVVLVSASGAGFAQTPAPAVTANAPAAASAAVPAAFRGLTLGMGLESAKEALLSDGIFGYRGERDVSLLPTQNRTLIETSGSLFISRSWLQFYEEKLYIMIFSLDPRQIDYYSMYRNLVDKYGEPESLDPRKALWTDGKVTLTLERPLTVKYVDAETFTSLLDASRADRSAMELLREDFIGEF